MLPLGLTVQVAQRAEVAQRKGSRYRNTGAVSPPPKDPADPPSAAELAAAREWVRQARAQGVALTGPGRVVEGVDEDGGTRNLDPLDEPGRQMV
jgi:hypothetical protein